MGKSSRKLALGCVGAMVFLLASYWVASSDAAEPPADSNTFALPRTYSPGTYELMEETRFLEVSGLRQGICEIAWYGLHVSRKEDGNGVVVRMNLRRGRSEISDPDTGKTSVADTDDRGGGLLIGLSEEGRLLSIAGGGSFIDDQEKKKLGETGVKELCQIIEETAIQYIGDPFVFCPTKAVAPGAKWRSHREIVAFPILGYQKGTEDANCVLSRIEGKGEHAFAVITIDGVRRTPREKCTKGWAQFDITGEIRINLRGDQAECNLTMVGGVCLSDKASSAHDVAVKKRITLTRKNLPTTRPAAQ